MRGVRRININTLKVTIVARLKVFVPIKEHVNVGLAVTNDLEYLRH